MFPSASDVRKTRSDVLQTTSDVRKTRSDVLRTASDARKTRSDAPRTASDARKSRSDVLRTASDAKKTRSDVLLTYKLRRSTYIFCMCTYILCRSRDFDASRQGCCNPDALAATVGTPFALALRHEAARTTITARTLALWRECDLAPLPSAACSDSAGLAETSGCKQQPQLNQDTQKGE